MSEARKRTTRRLVDRAKRLFALARERVPLLDHVVRMLQHYGRVEGGVMAGAVTYYGFLSFFPILALAFAVVGLLARVYGGAQDVLIQAINSLLPDMVGNAPGQISLHTFSHNANTVGIVGLLGVLYSGLGWLSAMRNALGFMFDVPPKQRPNFFVGKARDLVVLVIVGVVLLISVAITGAVRGLSSQILKALGMAALPGSHVLLDAVGIVLGVAATMVLFLAMFRLLSDPGVRPRALLGGALLGGIGFEVLKELASYLIGLTRHSPAFQAFGVALILLVWINYFSRVTMYAAAWAVTSEPTGGDRDGGPAGHRAGPEEQGTAPAGSGPAPPSPPEQAAPPTVRHGPAPP